MRTALLVLAFRHAECLAAAMPVYRAAGFDVFVHPDRKVDLASYKSQIGAETLHYYLIEDRHLGFWGRFNLFRTEISFLRYALNESPSFTEFVLVSDDIFLILPPELLHRFFTDDLDNITLRTLELDDPFYERYRNFYCFDHAAT